MLDVGFSEILLTSAIALIVLGPEKLPKVARQVGNWVGRARAMARQLTEQLEREVSAEELLKETKSNKTTVRPPPSSDPAPFDTSYTPNPAQPEPPQKAVASPSDVTDPPITHAPTAVYSRENAAGVQGADWHPSPPENKAANE
jgi:sec-independent protein translocase protein TatB